jgi:hypothetical protein
VVIAVTLLGLGASLALSLTATRQYATAAQLLVQSAGSVNLATGAESNALTPAGMVGDAAVRVTADLAALGVLAAHPSSPGLFARAGLAGAGDLGGGTGAITEMEKA